MSDAVDRLFGEYIAEHKAGGTADPVEFIARAANDGERRELAALIDGYLARAPRRQWDPDAFAGSTAERVADGLERAIGGAAGMWPVELPRLRERARLRRAELVHELAAALGVGDREEKVARYYHQMEQGLLPAAGVSDRVLVALAGIVDTSLEALRRAGQAVAPGPAAGSGVDAVFARTALPMEDALQPASSATEPASQGEQWDEVDDLFRSRS